jgi:type I restriction enzyme M protein
LVHSIPNIVKGNTILEPYHKEANGKLKQFDFIVSNPPFKLDFSDYVADLDNKVNNERFFAGVPNVPKAKKDGMAIYPLFIQHIMYSLSAKGKAAIVVPTGFITAQSGIERKIREKLVEQKMLRGVISMPSNIFATTGTNVSILFIDNENKKGDIVLMDASKLGTTVKDGKNQKTLLSHDEEQKIINTFNKHEAIEGFTVVVSYEQIAEKNYSFSAGQYFDVKIEYTDITPEEFAAKMEGFKSNLDALFAESKTLEKEIQKQLNGLKYE